MGTSGIGVGASVAASVGASVGASVAGASVAGASVAGGWVAAGVAGAPQAARIMLAGTRSDNNMYRLRFTFLLLREIEFGFNYVREGNRNVSATKHLLPR
jgi:hypothetical protein